MSDKNNDLSNALRHADMYRSENEKRRMYRQETRYYVITLADEVLRLQERCAQLEAKASAHDDEGYELFRGRMF